MLVIRRSRHVIAPLVYCFPGGGIEDGETEEAAAVREVHEEIGLEIRPLRRLWECVTAWKVHLAWWLAEMDPRAIPVPNPRRSNRSIGSPCKKWPVCLISWIVTASSSI